MINEEIIWWGYNLNNFPIDEVTSAKYKKDFAEVKADYRDTKDSFEQTYELLEEVHKNSQ